MRFCWLANTTGHENEFLAFDMLQEHNVRDLKVSTPCPLQNKPDNTLQRIYYR